MKSNKSKINLANKICSTLFFVFAVIRFILSIFIVVKLNGSDTTYKIILNIPFTIIFILSIGLNAYLIFGLIKENKKNYKNPILYLLSFTLLFSIIAYIYCVVMFNIKPIDSSNFTSEFWLILVSTGFSVLFSCWNWLINWGFLRAWTFSKKDNASYENDRISSDSLTN